MQPLIELFRGRVSHYVFTSSQAVYRRSYVTYDSLSPEARTLVDEQELRDKASALSVSQQLGMWP